MLVTGHQQIVFIVRPAYLVSQVGGEGHVRGVGSAHCEHVLRRVLGLETAVQELASKDEGIGAANAK